MLTKEAHFCYFTHYQLHLIIFTHAHNCIFTINIFFTGCKLLNPHNVYSSILTYEKNTEFHWIILTKRENKWLKCVWSKLEFSGSDDN